VDELVLIGDLNMRNTNWDTFSSSSSTEQMFLDTFNDLSLSQVVSAPTHNKGNILDILLTDKPEHSHSIKIDSHSGIGGSDHYPIEFKLRLKACRKKSTKRCIFNL
jgi:endonuclease/exonuclease/phosphatase family metal-dependent hydrolase